MTRSEALVRSVLGPRRREIRPFVYAIECIIRHSFAINCPIEDIQVSKVIYPEVAKLLSIRNHTAARQIQRIANNCWEQGDREQLNQILGGPLPLCPPPHDMLFYFAAFSFYGLPFQEVMRQELAAIF